MFELLSENSVDVDPVAVASVEHPDEDVGQLGRHTLGLGAGEVRGAVRRSGRGAVVALVGLVAGPVLFVGLRGLAMYQSDIVAERPIVGDPAVGSIHFSDIEHESFERLLLSELAHGERGASGRRTLLSVRRAKLNALVSVAAPTAPLGVTVSVRSSLMLWTIQPEVVLQHRLGIASSQAVLSDGALQLALTLLPGGFVLSVGHDLLP